MRAVLEDDQARAGDALVHGLGTGRRDLVVATDRDQRRRRDLTQPVGVFNRVLDESEVA